LKIVLLLPEFQEGGVERHVLWLAAGLRERGESVIVVSRGGRLVSELPEGVEHLPMPVHAKNPLTGIRCALSLAARARREGWDLLHAHSRVPAWIAWWASSLSGVPWIMTCHARYSLNAGLFPIRRAAGAICVSEAVRSHLGRRLPDRFVVILNGLPDLEMCWRGAENPEPRFLFLGRLTRVKGADLLPEILGGVADLPWRLDVVGDGPLRGELERRFAELGLTNRVVFWGEREDGDEFLARCSCLLFPSRDEGMGLTLARAVQMGVPAWASDLSAVREFVRGDAILLPPGESRAWSAAIRGDLRGRSCSELPAGRDFSLSAWLDATWEFYVSCVS
jgi:glycosyltransferase involved in cell wall biosynthesis